MSTESIWNDSNLKTASAAQMGTLAWAQANQLSAVKAQLAVDNANRVAEYETQFARYSSDKDNQPAASLVAPVPAIAEVVITTPDGWAAVGPGTEPVCPVKVWAPKPTTPSAWFTAGSTGAATVDILAGKAMFTRLKGSDGSEWLRVA